MIVNCITRVNYIRTIMILLIGWMHDFLKDTVATCLSPVGGKPLSRKSRCLSERMIPICRGCVKNSIDYSERVLYVGSSSTNLEERGRHTESIDTGSPDNSETKHLVSYL